MMRIPTLLALLLVACSAPPASVPQQGPALELAGRVAGPVQRCVNLTPIDSFRVSENDPHVLLYGNGRKIYANPLAGSCGFGPDDVLVTQPLSSTFCSGELVRSFDRHSGIPGPACVIGDFIPYTRATAR